METTTATRETAPMVLRVGTAVVAVLVAAAVHVIVALDATGPIWAEDEVGVLANSRVIAGVGEPWTLHYLPYYPGWSVLMAPLWWFTEDPATVYRWASVIAVIVALAAIVPLSALARRVGLDGATAVTVAAVVVVSPARTVMSNYVITENFLVLMVALTAVAALRFTDRPNAQRAAVLALAASYTFFTHGRAVSVVIATGTLFVVALWRRRPGARLGLALLVLLTLVAYAVYSAIVGQMYSGVGSRESATVEAVLGVTPASVLRSLVGQLWYQQAAWLMASLTGLAVVVVATVRELRSRQPGVASWAALVSAGMLSTMAIFMGTALTDPANVGRTDYWFYGRYLDPFFVPLAVLGLSALLVGLRWRTLAALGGAAVVTTGAFLLVNVPHVNPERPLAVINVAGLLAWQWVLDDITSPLVAVLALALTMLMLLAAATPARRVLVAIPLLGAFASASLVTDSRIIDPFNGAWRTDALGPLVERVVPDGESIAFDINGASRAEGNRATFWLSPRTVEKFDSSRNAPPSEWVVAREEWPIGEEWGARRVLAGSFPDNALWVMPGPLQDRLRADGLLERPTSQPALRDYSADITLVGDLSDGCADACPLTIALRNDGRDVWAPLGTLPLDRGVVRLSLWWFVDGDLVAIQHRDLATSLPPGDEVHIPGVLTRPDEVGASAAELRVGIEQHLVDGSPGPTDAEVVVHLPALR